MSIEISIIIPTYNRSNKLKRCLNSILNQEYDKKKYEIIVINDVDPDDTNSIILNLMKHYSNIKLITNKTKNNVAYCRNQGIKKSKGKIIAFIDDDCIAHKHWLSQIEMSHKKHTEELAIGGKILSLNSKTLIGKFRDFQILYSLKRNWVKNNHFIYIPSCNTSYKKETFKKIGCFDTHFKTADDIELNIRLLKNNKPIYFNNKMIIFHDYPNSIKDFIKKSYLYGLFIPSLKKKYSEIQLTAPINFSSTLFFLFAPAISIFLKFFSVNNLIDKIKLFPLIILDELAYRFGIIRGLSHLK